MRKVLAVDLGGTKIAAAVVTESGEVLHRIQQKMKSSEGPSFVINQIAALAGELLKKEPDVKNGAIASAGPLDPAAGVLLNPTNMTTQGEHWGEIPIVSELQKKLDIPLALENDAAAAILAERWVGRARGFDNCMIITLGTGVGIGTIANGELVRAGRGLHPEASHIYIHAGAKEAPSGSGDFGSIEAYLSGTGFTSQVASSLGRVGMTGEELMSLAQQGDIRVLTEFKLYAKHMAFAINSYVVLYAPEIIVFAGGFSVATIFFLDDTRKILNELLQFRRVGVDLMPQLVLSTASDDMGLLGAGYVALKH